MTRRALSLWWVVGLCLQVLAAHAATPGAPAASAGPVPGRYEATLCVTVADGKPSCGPAEFELGGSMEARLRIFDISYLLWLYPGQLSVVLMQGSVQLHEFNSPYRWQGSNLQFDDAAKRARYEVKLGAPVKPGR